MKSCASYCRNSIYSCIFLNRELLNSFDYILLSRGLNENFNSQEIFSRPNGKIRLLSFSKCKKPTLLVLNKTAYVAAYI